MEQKNQQTFFCKEDFIWHYVSFYLDCLMGIVHIEDENFKKLYKELRDYVETKLFTTDEGDVVDMYIVIERMID